MRTARLGDSRKMNILLIVTDQMRGDCLGVARHPVLQTPLLDNLALTGTRFTSAYSACPICIPARRTLMSGQKPAHHGVVFNYDTYLDAPTLPQVLSDNGYQTYLSGKLHLYPKRKCYGFDHMVLADGPGNDITEKNDHYFYLRRHGFSEADMARAHGVAGNSWHCRPWHLPEHAHPTNWCVSEAIDFLERRDPTRPFFLNVGIFHPHPPCTPPEFYYQRYLNMELPEPVDSEWSRLYDRPTCGFPLDMAAFSRLKIGEEPMRRLRAAYYASIAYIDDQLQRLLQVIPPDTMIIFTSDHGEMLGDHQFFGKCVPYEPSTRVPFIIKFPTDSTIPNIGACERPIELMDIMPTILDAVGIDIPDTVDGQSIVPLLKGSENWREMVHGEVSRISNMNSGVHYLTDGKYKYVWWPGLGQEQFFNLEDDPREINDQYGSESERSRFRNALIDILRDRPEQFVVNGKLQKLSGPTKYCLPGLECPDHQNSTLHDDIYPIGFKHYPGLKNSKR